MKESTKLILMYAGGAVVGNMLLASPVASATAEYPKVAAGGEGALALGGAYGAWKFSGKKRAVAAIIGGLSAGLLVNSIQSGLLTAPPPKPAGGATPQSMPKTGPGSSLPTSGAIPVQGIVIRTTPSGQAAEVTGQVPGYGAALPPPNRPPTAAEQAAYDEAMAREAALQREAEQRWAEQNPTQGGAIPTVPEDSGDGGLFGWLTDQSGGAMRISNAGAVRRAGFGGMAASFRRR